MVEAAPGKKKGQESDSDGQKSQCPARIDRGLTPACSCSREFQREPTENGQVGVEADALDPPNAEPRQRVMVLKPPKLPLHSRASAVEPLPPSSVLPPL